MLPTGMWQSGLFLVLNLLILGSATLLHKKYEYKYCFKPPFLTQQDGSVPFWTHTGHAQANEELIRLTGSMKSQKGSAWSRFSTNFTSWEVEMTFKISGDGRTGADGLAFWFTDKQGVPGSVFGSNDQWNGLGLMLDSFDNDNKGNNPFIYGMVNDGTKVFNHENDGGNQIIAGCIKDYRNKVHPTKLKIEYNQNILTVQILNGVTNEESGYEMCFRAENVYLPQSGFFGLSAATGGVADNHDISSFVVYSLTQSTENKAAIPDTDKERYSKEYDQFSTKLEQKKEEFQKQHPEKVKKTVEQQYETAEERELRQIYDGQNAIFRLTRELNHKCDEIIGRQERTLSLVQMGAGAGAGQAGGHVPVAGIGASRHELDTLLSNQREMVALARDIKGFVSDVHQKVSQGGGAQPKQGGGFDGQMVMHEIRDGVNGLKQDISLLAAKQPPPVRCPSMQGVNCISPGYFILFIIVQCSLFFGYIIYKNNKEAQAKKFY